MPIESLYMMRDLIADEISLRKRKARQAKESKKPRKTYIVRGLLDIPYENRNCYSQLMYLPSLLNQDWSHLFESSNTDNDFYVYAHTDIRGHATYPLGLRSGLKGRPFYIGKGRGDRAYNLVRNGGHGEKIKDLIHEGVEKTSIPIIVFDKLTEAKALELEAKLIHFFGTIYAGNRSGQRRGKLLNINYPPLPSFTGKLPATNKELKELSKRQKIESFERNVNAN